ncbi:YbaB/EbfC family nucleoid-associated protein [Campylobacter sp. MOP7]|uniref:YbaB/EbfC family nucleoid-associated protein n=1 Tax=Campylobacter canis TaxID=3378588 RepID=UPI00387E48B7
MFEGLDLSKMNHMLEEVQKKARELENETSSREFSVKSGGGLISVKANGKGELLDITIDDSLLEDKESLQILLISAVNDVMKMVEDDKRHLAAKMLGGFAGMDGK